MRGVKGTRKKAILYIRCNPETYEKFKKIAGRFSDFDECLSELIRVYERFSEMVI